uniref:LamG domain-containing protein n=1 Tax=Crenothrix polyspora TaxID=360316 RepID=UPI000B3606BC
MTMISIQAPERWRFIVGLLALLIACTVSNTANADLTTGLVAHWSFDDCTAKDNSGNGHDGTINGNPECVDGINGKAFSFNGTNSYINIPDEQSVFTPENMTISVFIKPSDNQNTTSGVPIILDKSHALSPSSAWVIEESPLTYQTDSKNLSFFFGYFSLDTGSFVQSSETQEMITTSNVWNHLLVVKEGSNVKNYLNGVLISSVTYSGSNIKTNANPLFIGAVNADDGIRAFYTGLVDDVRIYNRALSEAEVQSLYAEDGGTALNNGLVAHWSFDDCTAKDNSGNGHDGTINGNPQCVAGAKGKGFYFDGIDDYISVPLTQDLQFNPNMQSFSVTIWAKPIKMNFFDPQFANLGLAETHLIDTYTYLLNNKGFEAKRNAYTAEGGSYTATPLLDKDNWHSFSGVWKVDGNKIMSYFYIDGVLSATKELDAIPNGSYPWNGLFIGATAHLHGGRAEFFGDEARIYNRALTAAEVGVLYQQGTTPTITSITPTKTVIGKPTTFEVRGQNLSANMGFTVGDCAYSNVALAGGTPQLQRFVCTQFGAAGTKQGLIATKPGGTKLHGFKVSALLVPSATQMATLTGRVKIGSSFGSNVVLSRGDTVNACLTNAVGQFSCPVPAGWTGTLVPQAKGVGFSPALIYVKNAQGQKILNDAVTKFAFNGTPLDSFPANGLMTSDWQKLTTDNTKWIISTANGEKDDLRSYEGRFSFRSAPIAANRISAIQTTVKVTQAAAVVFARRVSSNAGHGVLSFYIDKTKKASWSGEKAWQTVRFPLTAGTHTLRWEYKKDAGAAKGADAAWIDEVSY